MRTHVRMYMYCSNYSLLLQQQSPFRQVSVSVSPFLNFPVSAVTRRRNTDKLYHISSICGANVIRALTLTNIELNVDDLDFCVRGKITAKSYKSYWCNTRIDLTDSNTNEFNEEAPPVFKLFVFIFNKCCMLFYRTIFLKSKFVS